MLEKELKTKLKNTFSLFQFYIHSLCIIIYDILLFIIISLYIYLVIYIYNYLHMFSKHLKETLDIVQYGRG